MVHLSALPVLLALALAAPAAAAPEPLQRVRTDAYRQEIPELVVLVHGMGRTSASMLPLAVALEREGYEVLNWGYSSFCCSIAELGQRLERELREYPGTTPHRIHFVGHSLGNIIIRQMLGSEGFPHPVGHVVMLAPPNQGSHEADRHARFLGWLLPPMTELRTDSASTVRTLPALEGVRIGVIAGKHDGKVLIEETHLPEESARVIVPAMHTFIMWRPDVQRLIVGFLRTGRFPEP
jgi:triacylglycerol esterase/lipase EstA (alpha/beta hydrolase family)